jgi:integrase
VQGSRFWYIVYYDAAGKQQKESSGSEVKQVAIAMLRDRLKQKDEGKITPAASQRKVRYEELRNDLLTYYTNQGHKSLKTRKDGTQTIDGLSHLDEFFAGKRVSAITTNDLRAFITKRQAEGAQNGTINRNLSLLRAMLNVGAECTPAKVQKPVSFKRIFLKEADPREGFLEADQFEQLKNALAEHLRPLLMFLYYTGCRLGAAQKLRWEHVNLFNRIFRLPWAITKSGEVLELPIPDELYPLLAAAKRKEGPVFHQGSFRKRWQRACVRVGLGHWQVDAATGDRKYVGLNPHDFRRSTARDMLKSGSTEKEAMTIGGWKTRSVFERYHIVDDEDLKLSMQRRQAYHAKTLEEKRVFTESLLKVEGKATLELVE